jgi:hypothetical protein
LRGLHLLEIKGVTFDENASQPSNEFLFEIMEVNEELDESSSMDVINAIKSANESEAGKLVEKIAVLFEKEDFDRALELLQHMKYRERVAKRVEKKIESL